MVLWPPFGHSPFAMQRPAVFLRDESRHLSATAMSVSSCYRWAVRDAATRSAKQGAINKVAGPNTSSPNVTLRYRLSGAPRDVSNGRMPMSRAAYPEIAPETRTVAAYNVFACPSSLCMMMLMLMLIATFRVKARLRRPQIQTFSVWVAISHLCASETSCSSAKVLVTDAGVGPGT